MGMSKKGVSSSGCSGLQSFYGVGGTVGLVNLILETNLNLQSSIFTLK